METRHILTCALVGAFLFHCPVGCSRSDTHQRRAIVAEFALPPPDTSGDMSLEEAIVKRRSHRDFAAVDLSLEQVGQLVWAAQGVTDTRRGYRAAPSAGALYPLELYVVKSDGVFHYVPRGHKLAGVTQEDVRAELSDAALGQPWVRDAPVDLVIAAVFGRTRTKYRDRAARYVHIEVGHAAQNVLLEAVALGLSAVPVGAFNDQAVAGLLALPEEETPLYIIPVGYPGSL